MIKTLHPLYSTGGGTFSAKTAEILSRYRPIAPKPESGPVSPVSGETTTTSSSSISPKMRNSPYLRTLWPHLQARPTRTRKRGRGGGGGGGGVISPPLVKRLRTNYFLGLASPGPVNSHAKHVSFQGISPGIGKRLPGSNLFGDPGSLQECPVTTASNLVTLPLLACSVPSVPELMGCTETGKQRVIDLNVTADNHILEEKDLLKQLQDETTTTTNIIAPQPVRPVGSSINVKCINEDPEAKRRVLKNPEEVEEEVESDALPAVISDSNNKVRLANSAYKEMVGQPECSWLDLMVVATTGGADGGRSCKRIGGEVSLEFTDSTALPAYSSNGFSCWVRIEWGGEGKIKKNSIDAFCDVVRLCCDSKDYVFTWRFHTYNTLNRENSQSITTN